MYDLTPKFEKLTLTKDVETYQSDNSGYVGCFCTGACDKNRLGYCPNSSIKDETPAEKARRLGVNVIPDIPPRRPENPVIAVCGRCAREIMQHNNQCCMDSDCPCGLGPILC